MQLHQVVDACLFALAFRVAYVLRQVLVDSDVFKVLKLDPIAPFGDFVWLYIVLIPAAPLILEAQGFYARPLYSPRTETWWQLFKGCLFTSLVLVVALFLGRQPIARYIPFWFGVVSFVLVAAKEEVLLRMGRSKLAQTQYVRHFIFVGAGEEASRMRQELKAKSQGGIEIVAELDLTRAPLERLVEMLHEYSVNGVIVSAQHSDFDRVEKAIHACEVEGVEVWLVAEFFRTQISRTSLDDFYGRPVMVFRTAPEASWQSSLKQLIDFAGAAVVLIGLSWLFVLLAVLVKLTSRGPILFRQQRSGLNGRPFTIYKFRTMVSNAEQVKAELAALNEMKGPVFKITKDPRITPVGRILRRFSLDEFPQFFNVLRGEMSLVGPRPLPVDEVKRFDDVAQRRRLSVKPGLTCLWQISGRSNVVDFAEWVRLDLEYIDNWSLWLDVKILWRTIPIVVTGAGAK